MPFLNRSQVDSAILRQGEANRRTELVTELRRPGLTREARVAIRDELKTLGTPRGYSADSLPRPWAISVDELSPPAGAN